MRAALARLGLTEGRLYTVGVVAIVAVLLVPSLARLHAPPSDTLAAPSAPANVSALAPSTGFPDTALDAFPPIAGFDAGQLPPSPLPSPGAGAGSRSPAPSSPSDAPPCAAAPTNEAAKQLLAVVDTAAGGALPDKTVVSVLAVATGCSAINPAILAIAALIDVGDSLPDLGLEALEPDIPFVEIPAALLPLLKPLASAVEPVCAQIGTAASIIFIAAPYYPAPIDGTFTTTLFHALSVCGQLKS